MLQSRAWGPAPRLRLLRAPAPSYDGERLRALREEARLSQRELADLLGIGRTTLQTIERGERYANRLEAWAIKGLFGSGGNNGSEG